MLDAEVGDAKHGQYHAAFVETSALLRLLLVLLQLLLLLPQKVCAQLQTVRTSLSVRGCCCVLNRFQSSVGCWNRRVRPAGTTDTSCPPSPPACVCDSRWARRQGDKAAGEQGFTSAGSPVGRKQQVCGDLDGEVRVWGSHATAARRLAVASGSQRHSSS
jgi:hypothetical protein